MRTKQNLRVASLAMLGATALTLTTLGAPAQAMRSTDVANAGTNCIGCHQHGGTPLTAAALRSTAERRFGTEAAAP